jgi:hypothetical protein
VEKYFGWPVRWFGLNQEQRKLTLRGRKCYRHSLLPSDFFGQLAHQSLGRHEQSDVCFLIINPSSTFPKSGQEDYALTKIISNVQTSMATDFSENVLLKPLVISGLNKVTNFS